MPRAAEHEATPEPARPGAKHESSHDDDHDRNPAHKASMAGLRRESSKPASGSLAGVSARQWDDQHRDADTASFHGLEASMTLVTAKIRGGTAQIEQIITSAPTMAGVEPQRQALEAVIQEAAGDLSVLDQHVALKSSEGGPNYGMTKLHVLLDPQLGGLESAIGVFHAAVGRAAAFVAQHNDQLGANTDAMSRSLQSIRYKLGKETTDKITRHRIDTRPETTLRAEALGANLTAVYEAARAVRMGLTAGDTYTVSGDLQMMLRHTAECDTLLGEITDRKTLRGFKSRIHQILDEIHRLDTEVSANPTHEIAFRYSQLRHYLPRIRAKIGA